MPRRRRGQNVEARKTGRKKESEVDIFQQYVENPRLRFKVDDQYTYQENIEAFYRAAEEYGVYR
jgi:hypothetical protein